MWQQPTTGFISHLEAGIRSGRGAPIEKCPSLPLPLYLFCQSVFISQMFYFDLKMAMYKLCMIQGICC